MYHYVGDLLRKQQELEENKDNDEDDDDDWLKKIT